jgi:hypothetical protein
MPSPFYGSPFTQQLVSATPVVFDCRVEQYKEAKVEYEIKGVRNETMEDNNELKNAKKKPIISALNLNSIKNL